MLIFFLALLAGIVLWLLGWFEGREDKDGL
jgi:hypothetical protein